MKESSTTSIVRFITISSEIASQRIDNFLFNYWKGLPKSRVYRLLRKGEVSVNKKRVKPEYKLKDGDELRIPPVRLYSCPENNAISLNFKPVLLLNNSFIYEDSHLLILNKPSGIAVHGGSGLSFGLIEALRALHPHAPFLELVHRLDKDTSGVLLVAKKRSTLRILHEQLRNNRIKKDYLALVRGCWNPNLKEVSIPILKAPLYSRKDISPVSSYGKPSITRFQVEEKFSLATLVKAWPVTGRTHQIRIHTKYAGHPIAFDKRYGDNIFDEQLKNYGLKRLFLHAMALSFEHPHSRARMKIEAPLEESLHQCLSFLRIAK